MLCVIQFTAKVPLFFRIGILRPAYPMAWKSFQKERLGLIGQEQEIDPNPEEDLVLRTQTKHRGRPGDPAQLQRRTMPLLHLLQPTQYNWKDTSSENMSWMDPAKKPQTGAGRKHGPDFTYFVFITLYRPKHFQCIHT